MDYELIVLLLDSQETLTGGGDVDQPRLSVGEGFVEKLHEVAVVPSIVSEGQLVHSGGELFCNLML